MKALERQKMPTTIEHIKGAELPAFLLKKLNVRPDQFLKITFEIEENEFDIDNLGDNIINGLKEILEAKNKGVKLQDSDQLLQELNELYNV